MTVRYRVGGTAASGIDYRQALRFTDHARRSVVCVDLG